MHEIDYNSGYPQGKNREAISPALKSQRKGRLRPRRTAAGKETRVALKVDPPLQLPERKPGRFRLCAVGRRAPLRRGAREKIPQDSFRNSSQVWQAPLSFIRKVHFLHFWTLTYLLTTRIRANWQKTEKNKKEQIRNNSRILSEEEKDELIKQALLEKHHLETYKNLYKIRNILYERYKTLLNEKVLKQRIQIKAFDLKQQQQLKRKEQKCTPGRKLPFCKLSQDTKYLESVSQSNSYWVTGLQNELTKLGIIKNQQDYENFWKFAWEDVPGPKIKDKLPDIKARMSAAKSLLFSTPTGIKPLQQVKSFPNSRLKKEASHGNTKLEDHFTKT
ncbi:PREDICTED: uncharacterized protein LOC106540581 [Thamnophis sirtalis]|uniref:Uncharacterized protein LOC106540581 n=1 Tax=Thamnophis sirtalis TaxID=35019 RepID=A0A6I9XA83_9SAUR|nr:PREDICTED: uncharacterized protein LOC106540581 [Thamnophis sirtalis]